MTFDLIFEQATIVDGSGAPPYRADLGVRQGKIVAIGRFREAPATRLINAQGKILCPGFIDVHSHADMSISLVNHNEILEPLVRQGITTFVGGNCGISLAPIRGQHVGAVQDLIEVYLGQKTDNVIAWSSFGEFLDRVKEQGTVLNMAVLAPHGVLRISAMGLSKRLATPDELKQMCQELRQCLEEGALGLSTGLQYFPGSQSDTDELLALGRVLHEYDAVFTSHLRSYSSNTLDLALGEVKHISREADIPVQVSHLFWVPHVNKFVDRIVSGAAQIGSELHRRWGLSLPTHLAAAKKLDQLGHEISDGLRLGIDCMPTSAGFTYLFAFFPPWALEGNRQKILERLQDPKARRRMRHDIEHGKSVWPHRADDAWSMNFFQLLGWDHIFVMSVVSAKNKPLEGLSIAALAKRQGKHPFDAAADLLIEEQGQVLVFETMTYPGDDFIEHSLLATMKDPNVAIATDAILLGFGRPSHLFYDCYPKFIARYIRDYRALSLSDGIRKCTSLPARQLGVKQRGLLFEGYCADLVLFDFNTIETHSSFNKPDVFPDGIEYVVINGQVVVDPAGYHPEPRPGQVLRRQHQ